MENINIRFGRRIKAVSYTHLIMMRKSLLSKIMRQLLMNYFWQKTNKNLYKHLLVNKAQDVYKRQIIDQICDRLCLDDCQVYSISLVCDEQTLRQHLQKDIDLGLREESIIKRSLERMSCYDKLSTHQIDISSLKQDEIIQDIIEYIQK